MDQEQYCDEIWQRATNLQKLGITDPITNEQLRGWHAQFERQEEILACIILDQLMVRSQRQVFSLIDALFLSAASEISDSFKDDTGLAECLRYRSTENTTHMVPVIGLNQSPTKSGPYILRLIQRRFRIADRNLIWPAQVSDLNEKKQQNLIFVDDFSGTGKQFIKFIQTSNLEKLPETHPNTNVFLFCLTIHENAILQINKEYPWIKILFAEKLDNSHHFINGNHYKRLSKIIDLSEIPNLYENVYQRTGHSSPNMKWGFGDLGLCYSFFHATPNNSIPLLWYESETWKPLISR